MVQINDRSIKRTVNPDLMIMPGRKQILCEDDDSGDGGYFEPGELNHEDALHTVMDERDLLARIEQIDREGDGSKLVEIQDELYDNPDPVAFFVFGTGGLICALSSINCIVVEHGHSGDESDFYPVPDPWVIFYAPKNMVPLLLAAAEHADTGLINSHDGMIEIFSNDVRDFNKMAEYLVSSSQSEQTI